MEYYYIFYTNNGNNMYERTCCTKESSEERVKKLKTMYDNAVYFKNEIPKDYKWFY